VKLNLDLTLPPPWVRALLVLVFLGFGVFVGNATSSSGTEVASVRPTVRLVLPAATPDSVQATPKTSPPVSAEATPEATSSHTKATGPKKSAPKTASSGSTTGSKTQGSGAREGAAGQGGQGGEGGSGSSSKLPPVKHVFLIVLADQPYAAVFGPASKTPYLAQTLEKQGELLVRYYAVAHDELANGVALVSGQGPTAETAANCPTYAGISPASAGAEGQVLGSGCVYPSSTQTLAGQLTAKHLSWRAYVEGMSTSAGAPATCQHPALGTADPTVGSVPPASTTAGPASQLVPANQPAAGISYTTFRNPFLYFHEVIDSSSCAADDVGMGQLSSDLANSKHTPSLAYIVPSLCDDGRDTPCASGKPGGLPPAESFLRRVVPEILTSKAYKEGGLLAITVDQAPATGIEADSSSCCGQPRFPGLPAPAPLPGGGQLPPPGGGQVGALLLSPFVKGGTVDQDPYNHFSLLRTIEDLFGLAHLGYASGAKIESFAASMFTHGTGK
jgi:hypothetical protein